MALVPTPQLPFLERFHHGTFETFQRPITEVDRHAFGDQPNSQQNEHALYTCGAPPQEYEQNCSPSVSAKGPFLRVLRGIGNSIPQLFYVATECSSIPANVSPSEWGKKILLSGIELRAEQALLNDWVVPAQIPLPAQPSPLCAAASAAEALSSAFTITGGVGYLFVDTFVAAQLYGTPSPYLRPSQSSPSGLEDPFGNAVVITRAQPEAQHKIYAVIGSFDVYLTDPHELTNFEADIRQSNTRRAIWEQEYLVVPNVCQVHSVVVTGPCS